MSNSIPRPLLLATMTMAMLVLATTAGAQRKTKPLVREIFVPFDSLNVLIDNKLQRVFLSRTEYEALLKKAQPEAQKRTPFATAILAADYQGTVENGRVRINGQLTIEVLKPGLHAIELPLSGVGVLSASLDGKPALLGDGNGKSIRLFTRGVGRRKLALQLVAPLSVSAALQAMNFQLPTGATSKLQLMVPGNVEVKSGAQVVRRSVDAAKNSTSFDFVLSRGPLSIVMSLNNHLLQQQQVVVARSLLIDNISIATESLNANVTLDVLHGASRQASFVVPGDFNISKVSCAEMSRWSVERADNRKTVTVHFREALTGTTRVAIEAQRTPPQLADWTMPQIQPLKVAGHVAVVGAIADRQLAARQFHAEGLIPLDTVQIRTAVTDRKRARPVVAYYAPNARQFQLSGSFHRPPSRLSVESSTLLVVDEKQHRVMGSISASSQGSKLFSIEFSAPQGWVVTQVTQENGQPVSFDRIAQNNGRTIVRAHLPKSVEPGTAATLLFFAEATPAGWLGPWTEQTVAFPKFPVDGAAVVSGAIAVQLLGDMELLPENAVDVIQLEEKDRKRYGLATRSVAAAYQFDLSSYQLTLRFKRKSASMSARTFSFFHLTRGKLRSHFELIYQIRDAKVSQLSFELPATTPSNISIRGLQGTSVKETKHQEVDGQRWWTVQLANPRLGQVHLSVSFDQQLKVNPSAEVVLPRIQARNVRFQTRMVAVEGHPDFDVDVETKARSIDVGEMVAARYVPGRFLLGSFRLVDNADNVTLNVTRRTEFALPQAIIQQASLDTIVASNGSMVTQAAYQVRTNALFLEARLPVDSKLWSVTLDGRPLTPQSSGKALILGLTGGRKGQARLLKIVYQSSGNSILPWGRVRVPALVIAVRAGSKSAPVPIADVRWRVLLPKGMKVYGSKGNVQQVEVARRTMQVLKVAGAMHVIAGRARGWEGAIRESSAGGSGAGWNSYPPLSRFFGNRGTDSMVAKQDSKRETSEAYDEDRAGAMNPPGDRSRSRRDARTTTAGIPPDPNTARPKSSMGGGMGGGASQRTLGSPGGAANPFGFAQGRRKRDGAKKSRPDPSRDSRDQGVIQKDAAKPTRPQRNAPRSNASANPSISPPLTSPREQVLPDDWTLEGVRSLNMDVSQILNAADGVVAFNSLGESPELNISVGDDTRLNYFAWAIGLVVGFIGVLLTTRSVRTKSTYVVLVLVSSSVLPLLTGMVNETGKIFDYAFFAGAALIVYYIAAHLGCSTLTSLRNWTGMNGAATAMLLIMTAVSAPAIAQKQPVKIPQDAVIIPYDPGQGLENIKNAKRILVPYAKYIELQRLANPDKAATIGTPIVPFAFADSQFSLTLADSEHLLMNGKLQIEVFAKGNVFVPLRLENGVLMSVELDGKPAQIRLAGSGNKARPNLIVVLINKPGRHNIDLSVRFHLNKQGGWRQLSGRLPSGVSSRLTLTVPATDTDVRLVGIKDRPQVQTTKPNQQIITSLNAGRFGVQWRPKVTRGEVDQTLSANSLALVDVRDDGIRAIWQVSLSYRRGRRGSFSVLVPAEFLVEDVTGTNIRGWQDRTPKNAPANADKRIDVTLLNAVTNGASFQIHLARRGTVTSDIRQFSVPVVRVQDVVLHRGRVVLRRSPLIKLRSLDSVGVNRTSNVNISGLEKQSTGWQTSPAGIQRFQTLQFASEQFRLRYATLPVPNTAVARLQTILRVADARTDYESRIVVRNQSRPIHEVSFRIPRNLEVKQVLPTGLESAIDEDFTFRRLTVRMPAGQNTQFTLGIVGQIRSGTAAGQLDIPQVVVENTADQQTELVVQGDPTLRVTATDLRNCERIFSNQVRSWLSAAQASLARLVLRCQSGDFAGSLRLVVNRTPKIECLSITNVHVTDHATIAETLLLSYNITNAGTRQIQFQLPATLRNAIIRAQRVRRIVKTATGSQADSPIQVTLELQEEIMGEFIVVIENDRLLTLTEHAVSIPNLITGTPIEQVVTLQYRGRDEMTEKATGFEVLNRQQLRWKRLAARFPQILRGNISKVFVARREATNLSLSFQAKPRPQLKTAGARIGLATTTLVVDATGAYRAEQVFQLNNETEQYLEVELPEGATLWSATVNRMPVRTTASSTSTNHVRIPLVKTAVGAEDYPVRIVYGGKVNVGWYSSVKFPMARTKNINVELSRLKLFLPKTHKWMNFAGAERQQSEDEFRARELMYLNSQLERASQALESRNAFDNARAQATLKKLQKQARTTQRRLKHLSGVGKVAESNTALERNLAQAKSQLRVFSTKSKSQRELSNRARFNSLLEQQKVQRSSNIVQGVGNNFKYIEKGKGGKSRAPRKNPMQQLQQQFMNQTARYEGRGKRQAGQGQAQGGQQQSNKELAKTYQSRLEQRAKQGAPAAADLGPAAGAGERDQELVTELSISMGGESGLLSLDVSIPQRGQEILFVSPRGDLQLTSVALRTDIVDRLQRLGILALVGVACVVGFAGRKPLKSMATSRWGIILLILVGIGCVVTNIYPIAGLVLGITAVCLAFSRRR